MGTPHGPTGVGFDPSRIRDDRFRALVTDAATAVAHIHDGDTVAISGFASAGTPKAFAPALADRIRAVRAAGGTMAVNLLTGASVANECEQVLAEVDGVALRMPYQSEPTARRKINAGEMDYVDVHLSHVAQQVWMGYYGDVDVAVVEVAAITEDGRLVPAMSVGNNKTWLEVADKVILEVNSWVPAGVEGMHDFYYGTALPPSRRPIQLTRADERIGQAYLEVDPAKVVAVVPTDQRDSESSLTAPDAVSEAIAGHVLSIVPMVPHVDHTEHDVQVIVTEHGLADLRRLSPRKRSRVIVDTCADPAFRPALHDYLDRAEARPDAGNTPHILEEAFSFHRRLAETGSMLG